MSKHVLIIGGGVIGLCTAYYALQKGHRVTLVERGAPDHDCCSLGNAGLIVPSHFVPLASPGMLRSGLRMMLKRGSPFSIRPRPNRRLARWISNYCRSATAGHSTRSAPLLRDLNLASRAAYEQFAAIPGADFGLQQRGLLVLCRTDARLHEEMAAIQLSRNLGMAAEALSPEETARLDPTIRMDIAGAVYFPMDCHLTPHKFTAWLTERLRGEGVEFRWSTELTGWRLTGNHVEAVQTSCGDITADEFVLAAGSWSARLAALLRIELLLEAGRGYSITLPHPPQLPTICSLLPEARVAVTPMGSSLRFAGTMEIIGLEASVAPLRIRSMIRAIPAHFPEFRPADFADQPVWSGLRPCSPDGLPYIGRFARYPNLIAATGHAMMGLSLAPITGRLVSQLLSDEPPEIDIEALRPERFGQQPQ